jgi:hypothetical protein
MAKLITLPDWGVWSKFTETWNSIQGFRGVAVLMGFIYLFQVAVGYFIRVSRDRNLRQREELIKRKRGINKQS